MITLPTLRLHYSTRPQLKRGDICSNHFITNFPQNVPVKIF